MDKWFYLTLGFILAVITFTLFNAVYGEDDLTINSLTISEFYTTNDELKIKYLPNGIAPPMTCLDISIFKPNGVEADITYDTACVNVEPWYQFEGYIVNPFNADDWTMEICSPVINGTDICATRDFDISFISLNNSTSTEVEETEVVEQEPLYCGFTGWKEEGDRNVAYRCGEEVASYIIDNPQDNFVGNTQTEHQQTLDLRLQILKVLENIFSIIFG